MSAEKRGIVTVAVQWIVGLGLAVVLLKILVLWLQPRLAFYPVPGPTPAPSGFNDFEVTTSDGLLIRGWYSAISDTGPVFLYSCGNAGNLADRTHLLTTFASGGGQVVAYNYRGSGTSEGTPTEVGVYSDAEAVYGYMRESLGVSAERIILWGHSLGGAVTCELAQRRPCAGIVLEATFRSAKAMARRMLPFLPTSWLMTYELDNETAMSKLDVPMLFVHGLEDAVIPVEHSRILHSLAPEPEPLWLVEGAGHNDIYLVAGTEFVDRLLAFGVSTQVIATPAVP